MTIPAPAPGSAALVTGASSGIGRELSRQLCERGHDLILVARRRDRLEALAEELRFAHGRRVEVISCDVSDPEARGRLTSEVRDLDLTVDVLALAAGFGMGGPFLEQDRTRLQLMIRTNLESVVGIVGDIAPSMVARRTGAILMVSSLAGNQPMPNFGVYAATKAALTSFGESLQEELRPAGVTVTVLCPAGVSTEFAQVAELVAADERYPTALRLSPEDCAAAGIKALGRGRRTYTPLAAARVLLFVGGHTPRGLWLRACRHFLA